MNPSRIHTTLTTPVDEAGQWTWSWACGDCPARSIRNYPTKSEARRVAAIHEDPSRQTTKTSH